MLADTGLWVSVHLGWEKQKWDKRTLVTLNAWDKMPKSAVSIPLVLARSVICRTVGERVVWFQQKLEEDSSHNNHIRKYRGLATSLFIW